MTTTFRADARAALVAILEDQKSATPTLLRKVWTARPGAFNETPCAYIAGLNERITWDAGTRIRVFDSAEIWIVDTYNEAAIQVRDQIADALVDTFNTNIQRVANAIIQPVGTRDDEASVFNAGTGTTTYYPATVVLVTASKWEGRS